MFQFLSVCGYESVDWTMMMVGHSHIWRLSEFVCKSDSDIGNHDMSYNVALNFKVSGASVIFQGTVSLSMLQAVETHHPCTMIFMIGENDKVSKCNIKELVSKIVATTSYFYNAWHIPFITVTQLLPRLITRHLDNARYDAQPCRSTLVSKNKLPNCHTWHFYSVTSPASKQKMRHASTIWTSCFTIHYTSMTQATTSCTNHCAQWWFGYVRAKRTPRWVSLLRN